MFLLRLPDGPGHVDGVFAQKDNEWMGSRTVCTKNILMGSSVLANHARSHSDGKAGLGQSSSNRE